MHFIIQKSKSGLEPIDYYKIIIRFVYQKIDKFLSQKFFRQNKMVTFIVFDKEKPVSNLNLEGYSDQFIEGVLFGAHIQWVKNYDKGFYLSKEADFDFMPLKFVQAPNEIRYKNLYFRFHSDDFLEGIHFYFKHFQLTKPFYIVNRNGVEEKITADLIQKLVGLSMSEEELKVVCEEGELQICLDETFWADRFEQRWNRDYPKPAEISWKDWYEFVDYFLSYSNYPLISLGDFSLYVEHNWISILKFLLKDYLLKFSDMLEYYSRGTYELLWDKLVDGKIDIELANNAFRSGHILFFPFTDFRNAGSTWIYTDDIMNVKSIEIKWLFKKGYVEFYYDHINKAAKAGNLELVKWLYGNGIDDDSPKIKPTSDCLNGVVTHGHFRVLKWLYEIMQVPANILDNLSDLVKKVDYKKKEEYVSMIKWLLEKGFRLFNFTHVLFLDDIEFFEWLLKLNQNLPIDKSFVFDDESLNTAASYGLNRVFYWLLEKDLKPTQTTINYAAEVGNLEIVQFLEKMGFRPEMGLHMNISIQNGHFRVIKWLVDQGYKFNQEDADTAVKHGWLKIVKLFWDHKIFPSSTSLVDSIINKEHQVANWLLDKGVKFSPEIDQLDDIFENITIEELNKLEKRGYSLRSIDLAIIKDRVDIVIWLLNKGLTLPDNIMDTIISNDLYNLFKYLWDKGYIITDELLQKISNNEANNIIFLLEEAGIRVPSQEDEESEKEEFEEEQFEEEEPEEDEEFEEEEE